MGIHYRIKKSIVRVMLTALCSVSLGAYGATQMNLIEFWNDHEPASLIDLDHSRFEEFLEKYVIDDHPSGIARFDYLAVSQSDFDKLESYLSDMQFMEPRQLTEAEAKAFWINLYNAATLHMVIEEFVDGNPTRIQARGVPIRRWRRDIITISEQRMSLEDILHGVIRPLYQDPRVHYALIFCMYGSPDMPTTVFKGDNNDALLEELEAKFLSKSRAVKIEGDQLVLSSIFKDYDTDFAPSQSQFLAYLRERVPEEVAQSMNGVTKVRYEFDDTVNIP